MARHRLHGPRPDPRSKPLSQLQLIPRMKRGVMRRCQRCGSEFYASPSRLSAPGGGQYCSRACRSTKVVRSCKRCGVTFLARSDRVVSFCSHECRKVPRGICVVDGCVDKAWCGDMCQRHYNRSTVVRINYGLTLAQDAALKAGGCAICGIHPEDETYPYQRGLHIDHDHDSGKVRAALCHGCNRGLGEFADDPRRLRRAADYIERHRKGEAAA
jgi:hypothetical protein